MAIVELCYVFSCTNTLVDQKFLGRERGSVGTGGRRAMCLQVLGEKKDFMWAFKREGEVLETEDAAQ